MISADFKTFVACELSNRVHHVWGNCSNKFECRILWSLKRVTHYNFTNWSSTRPVTLVAVKISVASQLETIVTFILDSADLCWPVTFIMEPVVSTVFDFGYISAFIIWLCWYNNIFTVSSTETWWTSTDKCLSIDVTTANSSVLARVR